MSPFLCTVAVLSLFSRQVRACTTLVVGRAASTDGSVFAAHSNDGDGRTVGNLARVLPRSYGILERSRSRIVSRGRIPQAASTYGYFTKVGGYAAMNDHQVGIAESTCSGVFLGSASGGKLNIVDLAEVGLERANTSRGCVLVMGSLAEEHGYYDNAESLLVVDPEEAWIFHILPDHTGASAVWAAQRVPDDHVGVVANSFTIRRIPALEEQSAEWGRGLDEVYLFSSTIRSAAQATSRWAEGMSFDFTRIFADREPGRKYWSGRRMWSAFQLLAPEAACGLNTSYDEYVSSVPYPATLPVSSEQKVDLMRVIRVMRNYYQDTPFDMRKGMAAGPFGTPTRALEGPAEQLVGGSFERSISHPQTIISQVIQVRSWLPAPIGGTLWFSFHAAHTSFYTPFPAVLLSPGTAAEVALPAGFTNNSLTVVNRGVSAFQAAKFVYNIAQLRFDAMAPRIEGEQSKQELSFLELQTASDRVYVADPSSAREIAETYMEKAQQAVSDWWDLSDELVLRFGDSYTSGYPEWWLRNTDVGFLNGPVPAPPVPSSDIERRSSSSASAVIFA